MRQLIQCKSTVNFRASYLGTETGGCPIITGGMGIIGTPAETTGGTVVTGEAVGANEEATPAADDTAGTAGGTPAVEAV